MAINFDRIVGVHEDALKLRLQRAAILSNNLANADTPNYLARDIDFSTVLKGMSPKHADDDSLSIALAGTHDRHFINEQTINNENLKYRVPFNPSQDGNTVEASAEYIKFSENAIRYNASMTFLSGKFRSMINAFKGE